MIHNSDHTIIISSYKWFKVSGPFVETACVF